MKFAYLALSMLSTLVLANIGYAHEIDLSTFDVEELVKTYNVNLENVPGFVKSTFGNERIDVYIDGEQFVGLVGKDGNITEYKKGGVDKPTMKIFTTSETIDHLIEGEKTLLEAVKDKSIQYEGVGFINKIKFGFIKIFQGIFLRK
ncbi:MAG: hypothetical protein HYS80_02140 [Candidatus Aenigmarchaeota archaeon]|nr:hypothetical protein [Candidatus Aenigmarchaeota archaeon]